MKKNKIIQFFLITAGILLLFFTYYSKDKQKIIALDDGVSNKTTGILTEKTSNIIENVNYIGTDNRGTFFELNAAVAEIKHEKPNISHLQDVYGVIKMNNLRVIHIRSDGAMFDKISNDCEFFGNVKITEQNNIITSDNLDLFMSKNLITAYNNVKYNGTKGFLVADKMDIDILKNETNIFMFKKNDKVKVKYKN